MINLNRRSLLTALAASPLMAASVYGAQSSSYQRQGRLQQSVMSSVWGDLDLSFEQRCEILARMGFAGMDLPREEQVPMLRDYGLAPTLMTGTGTSFQNGFIRAELHDKIEEETRKGIDMCG